MLRFFAALLLSSFTSLLIAQMPQADGNVNYGNEWFKADRTYLAVRVAEDGLFRVSAAQLTAAGLSNDKLEVIHNGQQVAFDLTENGLVFYGAKNRGELDRYLFVNPTEEQLNDRYSMYSDTATYYIGSGENGIRYQPNNGGNNAITLTQIIRRTERVFSDYYTKTFFRSSGASIYYSHYDEADGFGLLSSGDLLSEDGNTTTEVALDLPGGLTGSARLDVRYGTAFGGHDITVSADGNPLGTTTRGGWNVEQLSLPFDSRGEQTTVSISGSRSGRDKANLAWIEVTYPAAPTYDEALTTFSLPASQTAQTVTFSNLGAAAGAGQVLKAYGDDLRTYVTATVDDSGTATFTFPATASGATYHLALPTNLKAAFTETVNISSSLPDNPRTNYLLLTSERLDGSDLQQLADYRRSPAGGSHVVRVVNVEDLYEEFGYGVPRHPQAIRNYLAAARNVAPDLQYLFIVGKGREFADVRTAAGLADARETFFVPSIGFPAADNLVSAPVDGVVPALATGRLSAINEREIAIYLKKLRGVEAQINQGGQTIAERDWMKQVMHLGGGGTPGEQSSIKTRLNRMTDTIGLTNMGANVTAFFKTSTEPIQESQQDAIFNRINGGISMLTFMGHSSTQTFDFSIDDPANYDNAGRYPYMVSLGCYSGDAFTKERSISERFIFLEDKGAIAFAASKGVGYISALGQWGTELYSNLGRDTYGQGVGDALKAAIEHFDGTANFTLAILLEQFALSGDPAYRMHPRPGPDVVVDPASVRFTPEVVPAQDLTFEVSLRLLNLGRISKNDSINLRFRQELPGGEVRELATRRAKMPRYEVTQTFSLPNVGFPAVGQNRVLITVDIDDEVSEFPLPEAESNNELVSSGRPGIPLTVVANTARVAFPPEYAVVGGELEFIASTTNVLAEARDYVLQVATNKNFTDLLIDETINSPGGVIRFTPSFPLVDSTTYYWRISPDSLSTEGIGFIWSESSFTWLEDRPFDDLGWAVQDFGQLNNGEYNNIIPSTNTKEWNFAQTVTDIRIINAKFRSEEANVPRFEWRGQVYSTNFPWHTNAGLQFVVVDSTNNERWELNRGRGTYGVAPRSRGDVFSFDTRTASGREGAMNFIENVIEPGKYVLMYSAQRGNDDDYVNDDWLTDSLTYGKTLYSVLEDQGALQVRQLADLGSVPYVFVFQKSMGPITETVARTANDTISTLSSIRQNWAEGTWASPRTGPALNWETLSLQFLPTDIESADSCRIELFGYEGLRTPATRLSEERLDVTNTTDFRIALDDISADQYPYLQARLFFFDEEQRTVPQVKNLFVDYEGTGDVVLNPAVSFAIPDSIDQGQPLTVNVGYENISRTRMDSLLVRAEILTSNNESYTYSQRYAQLPPAATGQASFEIPTTQFANTIRLQVQLNPDEDQPETVIYNNTLNKRIGVGTDLINPNLAVFFDGRTITDGELISSRPEIHVQFKDNNRYLLLNDTSSFYLSLQHPSGQTERLSFADDRIEYITAELADDNTAEIFFRPELTEDGIYELMVNGTDRTGLLAGRVNFSKNFEVINRTAVSNLLAYPNPFSTQTRFVYTLTGSEVPATFRIQIMTVSGRVVRDIDLTTTESLKIGTHQTNFVWDGTDEYGDLLANGVYLYRVITTNDSGERFDKLDDNTINRFFEQDLGKIVIVR